MMIVGSKPKNEQQIILKETSYGLKLFVKIVEKNNSKGELFSYIGCPIKFGVSEDYVQLDFIHNNKEVVQTCVPDKVYWELINTKI